MVKAEECPRCVGLRENVCVLERERMHLLNMISLLEAKVADMKEEIYQMDVSARADLREAVAQAQAEARESAIEATYSVRDW